VATPLVAHWVARGFTVIPKRSFGTLVSRLYLSCRGSLPLALGFEPPRGSGYGLYVVAGCDGQNRLAARCPATTRPLIERCDWIAV
jgi:hypothetical protein